MFTKRNRSSSFGPEPVPSAKASAPGHPAAIPNAESPCITSRRVHIIILFFGVIAFNTPCSINLTACFHAHHNAHCGLVQQHYLVALRLPNSMAEIQFPALSQIHGDSSKRLVALSPILMQEIIADSGTAQPNPRCDKHIRWKVDIDFSGLSKDSSVRLKSGRSL